MIYEENIGFAVRNLTNKIRCKVRGDDEKVTGMHGWLMTYLYENRDKDIFQKDIESKFKIKPSTVTALVKTMEKNGLLRRQAVSYDARLKKLSLTEKGKELPVLILKKIEKVEQQLRKNVTEEELEIFFEIMEKMSAGLEEQE